MRPQWTQARDEALQAQLDRKRRQTSTKNRGFVDEDEDYDEENEVDVDDEGGGDSTLKANVRRHFGKASSRILKMINSEDNTEGAVLLIQRALLSSVITAMTQAEDTTLKTGGAKGIYAFNALISQIRELLGDIQSSQDTEKIALEIASRFNLVLRGLAEAVLDQNQVLKRELAPYVAERDEKTVNKLVDSVSKAIAVHIGHTQTDLKDIVHTRLCD